MRLLRLCSFLVAVGAGCDAYEDRYACVRDEQCMDIGRAAPPGRCIEGGCAWEDGACASGYRFGRSAGGDRAEPPERLRVLRTEELIVEGARGYLDSLVKLGVAGEITIAPTLVRVKGVIALVRTDFETARLPIPDDVVRMPAARVDSAIQEQGLKSALRPALDMLWRTAGLPCCQRFDRDGNYK